MPQKLKGTKIHKDMVHNLYNLVNSLCFCALVAKIYFQSLLKV
jgi:hypothetical protein